MSTVGFHRSDQEDRSQGVCARRAAVSQPSRVPTNRRGLRQRELCGLRCHAGMGAKISDTIASQPRSEAMGRCCRASKARWCARSGRAQRSWRVISSPADRGPSINAG